MIEVVMPSLHPMQRDVADSPARHRVVSAGRRFGKTRLAVSVALRAALMGERVFWVAPTYAMALIAWRAMRTMSKQFPYTRVHETDKRLSCASGGFVQVRSADAPDTLRGDGLDLVVIDEAAFVLESAWNEVLRPALADRKGRALLISTPAGKNWFWRAFQKGLDPMEPDWKAWHASTLANPLIDPREIEAAKRDMPERKFRQEILAEFIDDAGAVFRHIRDCIDTTPISFSGQIVIGVDWAKESDFTVFTVVDVQSRRVIEIDRFNQIDWRLQRGRLAALADQYRPGVILAESNSIGSVLIEQLQQSGLPVSPFVTTNSTKAALIDSLVLAFETGSIKIPDDPTLIGELEAFEAERLPSGTLRYSAPDGLHDDMVMSLALAWHAAAQPAFGMSPVKISRGAGRAF